MKKIIFILCLISQITTLFYHKASATITPIDCTGDVFGSLSVFGEQDTFSFNGIAGERFIIRMSEGSNTALEPHIILLAPGGSQIAQFDDFTEARIDIPNAPATGEYLIIASDEGNDDLNSYGLALQIVKSDCATAISDCSADLNSFLSGTAAMNAYQFDANAGERIIIRMAEGSNTSLEPQMELYAPDGTKIGEHSAFTEARIDVASTPSSGTYILVTMDEEGQDFNSYGLSLQIVKPECTISITNCSADLNGSLSGVAAMNAYQFEANAGERIIIRMAEGSNTALEPQMELYAPNGTKIGEHDAFTIARVDVLSAPETGTFILVVMDEEGQDFNSYGLSLQIVKPECTTSITDCSADLNGSLSGVAAMNAYQFDANAGERIIIRMAEGSNTTLEPQMELYAPNDTKIGEDIDFTEARIDVLSAPETGTYILVVMDEDGEDFNSYGLSLQIVKSDCASPITDCSADLNGSLSGEAAINAYHFEATAGERIIIRMVQGTNTDLEPQTELYAPNGTKIGEDIDFTEARIDVLSAPETGTYILVVMDEDGEDFNSYGLSLQIVKFGCSTNIVQCPFSQNGNLSVTGEMDAFVFSASQGNSVIIDMAEVELSISPTIQIFDPNGVLLGESSDFSTASYTLNVLTTGNYYVVVYDEDGGATGDYTFSVSGCTSDPTPCEAPDPNWLNPPSSICPAKPLILCLDDSDPNFDFDLIANGDLIDFRPGTSAAICFDTINLEEPTTFSLTATLKTDQTCTFDNLAEITVDTVGLNISYDLEPIDGANKYWRVFNICVEGGTPPFSIVMWQPEFGILEQAAFNNCTDNLDSLRKGIYRLFVEDIAGCQSETSLKVGSSDDIRIGFPEKPLLTPNGDGINDELVFTGILLHPNDETELTIYNRYGSILFQGPATNYEKLWDATWNGEPVPADTYFYTLEIFTPEKKDVYLGFITVVR